MAETKPIQMFLCHASEDKAAVEAIYERLKALGYQPWLDKRDLLPGQRWRSEIPKAIRASDYILIFLSNTSVAKRGYVQNEFKLALEVLREVPDGTIYAIPIRLDECPIPDQFGDLHWCNLFETDGFEYLLRALRVGKPSPEEVAAAPQPTSLGGAILVQPTKDIALTRQPFEPEMILIPAGAFFMGSSQKAAANDERPRHRLSVPVYYLAKVPVTNAQYSAFVQTNDYQAPRGWVGTSPPRGKVDHPVVHVSWQDGMAFCRWLSEVTGKTYSLPSEAEWEKGARGTDGRTYPWGNRWNATYCNADEGGQGETTRVGAYPSGASPYGLLDMAGNVWEWTRSLWGKYPYPRTAKGRERRWDLQAPDDQARVLRGGTFLSNRQVVRCAYRYEALPNARHWDIGFRVVMRPAS
jgi:formylglycine-generating enzyme required for sulfatase activity